MKRLALVLLFFGAARCINAGTAVSPPPAEWFEKNPNWSLAENVSRQEGGNPFQASGPGSGAIMYFSGAPGTGPQLRSRAYLGDAVVQLEFLTTPDAKAGIYLEGRFRIELGAAQLGELGALAETKSAEGTRVAPATIPDTRGKAGGWQTLEVRLRAPRFDEARNQVQKPLIIEAKINGQVVQSNVVPAGRSLGTELNWDDANGPTTIAVERGSVAVRSISIRRADFEAVQVPAVSGQPTNAAKLVDFVKQGDELFHALGCAECHATQSDDVSAKTGPNLFGLFQLEPRDRVVQAGEGHRFTIKADRGYLFRSIRTPAEELAVSERGANQGQAYPLIMPPFVPTVISDAQVDAIGSYLATLNEPQRQGAVVRLVEPAGIKHYDPLVDRLQLLVDCSVRIQRGPMEGVSARSIHVGQPNGINYSFDPRVLGIAKLWQGGFVDASGEYQNRGGNGLKPGYESREIDLGAASVILAPLNARGEAIDFTFKEPKFRDAAAIAEALNSPRDLLERIAAVDAQFLGYSRDSRNPLEAPTFKYRVGRNVISVRTTFADDGAVRIVLDAALTEPQTFALNETLLGKMKVAAGDATSGRWTLPAGKHTGVVAEGRVKLAKDVWRPKPAAFDHRRQMLLVEPSKSTLPSGYRAESFLGPRDNYGREQLFEPLGLALAPDGTIVVATRTAGIWRLSKGEWHLFAEGLFDGLGVQVEDEHGLRLVAGQKAELTRITDTNGDGLADTFETLSDSFAYHGNYHSYLHGPVRAADGSYFVTLNLDDAGSVDYEYRAGGKYMGTGGGYRGWAIRIPAKGGFEPWADGMRSPAGLGFGPDGRLWYADNQGEYMGTSKLFVVKQGAFYGHPSGLVDRPGMTPTSPEIAWDKVKASREMPAVLFPQSRLANSPGNPAWDTTGGRFGPFAGQMFIGDQTQSKLLRVATEHVGQHEQGVAIPFATDLQSGVMRPLFLPDGSLLLGQTGRGWQAKGGHVASLQRLVWDGQTMPAAIHHVSAIPGGFEVQFTVPLPEAAGGENARGLVAIRSWIYRDAPDYGSPELDEHDEEISQVEIGADRKSVRVLLAKTEQPRIHPDQTARVYRLSVDAEKLWGADTPGAEAFYTLYEFPAAE